MTLYAVIRYAHVVATLALFATLGMEAFMLFQLRRAKGTADAGPWVKPLPGLRPIASISLAMLFFSGGYMADRAKEWTLAWPKVALATLILMGALTGLSLRRLRTTVKEGAAGKITEREYLSRLRQPFLKLSVSVRAGLLLGLIMLMTAQPDLAPSLAILLIAVAAVSAVIYLRPAGRSAVTRGARASAME